MNKTIRIVIIIFAVVLILFVGARYFAFYKLREAINTQADNLRKEGYLVSFDSLRTNAFTNSISLNNLSAKFPAKHGLPADSSGYFRLSRIQIQGVSLTDLVLSKKLSIRSIVITHPEGRILPTTPGKDHETRPAKKKLKSISIAHLEITQADALMADSSGRVSNAIGFSAVIHNIAVNLTGDQPRFDIGDAIISQGKIKLPTSFYTLSFDQLSWTRATKHVKFDSLMITPWYSNEIFVKKSIYQTDRIDAKIHRLEIDGLDGLLTGSETTHISKIDVAFDINLYRDKRIPGSGKHGKKLLSRAIHNIHPNFQIDSVSVSSSSIAYVEVQNDGNPGHISFDALDARISNISNTSADDMKMHARTRLMNKGELTADFTFPANPDKAYSIKGSLRNLEMPAINAMLVPAAHAEIKKGHLEAMHFSFQYNEFRSDGNLTMNYSDLDVVSLLKNKGKDQREENKLVTLILKSFIVKKDMDKNKSTGTILFYRDDTRATFNYWWKSILSGVKSLYNLDKVLDTSHNKKK